jgi:hypothetical protein
MIKARYHEAQMRYQSSVNVLDKKAMYLPPQVEEPPYAPHDLVLALSKSYYVLCQLRNLEEAERLFVKSQYLQPVPFARYYTAYLRDIYEVYFHVNGGLIKFESYERATEVANQLIRHVGETGDYRLIGLAHLVTGLAYRKHGDAWKTGDKQAQDFDPIAKFYESHENLERAWMYFEEQHEQYRKWEILNEQSSLAQDWLFWLIRHPEFRPQVEERLKVENPYLSLFRAARRYAKKATNIAEASGMPYAHADTLENRAQLAYDYYRFLLETRSLNPDLPVAVKRAISKYRKESDDFLQQTEAIADRVLQPSLEGIFDDTELGFWPVRTKGKVHALRGKITVRFITDELYKLANRKKRDVLTLDNREAKIQRGLRDLYLAHDWFCRFSPIDPTNLAIRMRYLSEFRAKLREKLPQKDWQYFLRQLEIVIKEEGLIPAHFESLKQAINDEIQKESGQKET